MSLGDLQSVAAEPLSLFVFARDVRRLYRHNWGLFLRIILFAFIVGYLAVAASNEKAQEFARTLPPLPDVALRLGEYVPTFLKIWATRLVGVLISWLIYCFAFAATSEAVAQIRSGECPTAKECFARARERASAWIWASLFIFALLFVGYLFSLLIMEATFDMGRRIAPQHVLAVMETTAILFWLLVLTFVSNYALAIAAATVDNLNPASALARSNELTRGNLSILMWLILESVVGTYVATAGPFWVAYYVLGRATVSQTGYWVLLACGSVLSGLVQPIMLIGLSLLYWRTRGGGEQPA